VRKVILKRAMHEHEFLSEEGWVEPNEVVFIASGTEYACADLTVDGVLRNDGKIVCGVLTANGKVINNGSIEVGGYD